MRRLMHTQNGIVHLWHVVFLTTSPSSHMMTDEIFHKTKQYVYRWKEQRQ